MPIPTKLQLLQSSLLSHAFDAIAEYLPHISAYLASDVADAIYLCGPCDHATRDVPICGTCYRAALYGTLTEHERDDTIAADIADHICDLALARANHNECFGG